MAERGKNEISINEPAIDEDSSEILVKDNKTKLRGLTKVKNQPNRFSENIFFYSYPFPIRYFRKPILSEKKNQKA
jgi:hypothetical protein